MASYITDSTNILNMISFIFQYPGFISALRMSLLANAQDVAIQTLRVNFWLLQHVRHRSSLYMKREEFSKHSKNIEVGM